MTVRTRYGTLALFLLVVGLLIGVSMVADLARHGEAQQPNTVNGPLPVYTRATLPSSGTEGQLAWVSDVPGSVWIRSRAGWQPLAGNIPGGYAKTLADTVVTPVMTVTVPNSGTCHVVLWFHAHTASGANSQMHSGNMNFSAVATSGGVVTAAANDIAGAETTVVTAGTYTDVWAVTTAANSATLTAALTSSLGSQTLLEWTVTHNSGCLMGLP